MIDIKIGTKAKKSGSTGGSSQKTTYINGTISEADHASRADKAKKAETAEKAEYADKAGNAQTANYAQKAGELDEDAEVLERYVRKDIDDTVHGQLTLEKVAELLKGLQLGDGNHGMDENGNAQLGDVVLDRMHDPKSTPKERVIIGAQGFDMYIGDDGKSHLYIDNLSVRNRLFASSMEIRKVSYAGGTTIFSNAGSTIAKVAVVFDAAGEKVIAYKCYAKADDGTTATANWWKPGMMGLCQTFNIKAGVYEGVQNRYYWRLCIGAGQEYLDDGKLYDYFTLSNLESFSGADDVQPDSEPHILANELGELLQFDGVLVSIVSNNEYTSFAAVLSAEGITKDDAETDVGTRRFFGYDPQSNAAPAVGDVVVNVGDQVRWNQYGNIIKLSTSVEDNGTDTAPSIAMYHGIGAPRRISSTMDGTSVWQWKEMTSIVSPIDVMYNAKNFRFITYTDEGDMIDVGSVYDAYELAGSYGCAVRATDGSYTPALDSISFSLSHRIGNHIEAVSDFALRGIIDGKTYAMVNKKLSDLSAYLKEAKMVKLEAVVDGIVKASIDFPVMEDGQKGDKGDKGTDGNDGIDGTDGKDGVDGKDGTDGEDAVNIIVNPATIIYNTDENGVITSIGNKYATITAMKGGKTVDFSFMGDPVCTNCAAQYPTAHPGRVEITNVLNTSVKSTDGTSKSMPHTSGSVKCALKVQGAAFVVTIPFQVSMNAFMGRVYWNNKELSADFTNLKTDLKSDNPDILKSFGGSLKVSVAQNMFANYEGLVGADGKITKTKEAGLVTQADFAGLFASAFSENKGVVKSEISAFITSDDAGKLISNATIKADQITLEGVVTANNYFKINTDGSMEATKGKFGFLTINSDGTIVQSGMKISNNGMLFYHEGEDAGYGPDAFFFKINTDESFNPIAQIEGCNCPNGAMEISTYRTGDYEFPCIPLVLSAAAGHWPALKINGGYIHDMRGDTFSFTSSVNMNESTHDSGSTIFLNNTKSINIYLPTDPMSGQYYRFIMNGSDVTFHGNGKNLAICGRSDLQSSCTIGTNRTWIECMYDGSRWFINYN